MAIATTNPATGEEVKTFDALTDAEIERKVQRAADTFREWRKTTFEERREKMLRVAEILEAEADELGRTATLEMGKTYVSAVAEVQKCAKGCRFYAENAGKFLADERLEELQQEGATAYVRYEPLGPTLEIMPWNFPYWQVFRHAAPGLMAGNVALLKHASNVPQVALAIEDVFHRAGFPEGAFQTLLIGSDKIKALIEDDRIRAATLTGSEPAGRMVGSQAGANVKPSVLELGGSDPFIVMPSADLDRAVETAVASRTLNNGQSCVNAKRIIVHDDIADEFIPRFVEKMEALVVGDPMEKSTEVGPLSSAQGLEDVAGQVKNLVDSGAKLLTGGERIDGPGYYYRPTVISEIPADAPARREEIFGPVAAVYRVSSIDEAIEVANDSPFGLSSSAWTTDDGERERFVREIEAGMVYINKMTESTPEVPFGGAKNSGYGRELSRFGIQEFTNQKLVWLQEA
ncbi:NAD-dependent succinate-semialdehyde dehydrogenase [Rubrobacter indicoceani]|uniref:NAD-dependent succinate-semialdehyde dehydrogenase n=1 Tax=Rubrobacter indicoceani TaxID=2051957 RepID=UPI000E5B5CD8|nr:NAD-dependent succinate-semialdehyde dehydrogenase [Rubrobacter indicoceani]